VLQAASGEVDKANIEVTTFGNVQNVRCAGSLQQAQASAGGSCRDMADNLKALVNATGSAKSLVVAAQSLQKAVPALVSSAKLTIASAPETAQKHKILGSTKGVLDSFLAVVKSNK